MVKQVPVVFHVPHSSRKIPLNVRPQFLLKGKSLKKELILMTDSYTQNLYVSKIKGNICTAKVSRLVVDVERFADDSEEIMSKVGMGVIYTRTSEGDVLRKPVAEKQRQKLIYKYYLNHHRRLEEKVAACLKKNDFCLIVDCHSFSSFRQKYEVLEEKHRPEICIGTDSFHTEKWIENLFVKAFEGAGFEVSINSPFAGSLVPLCFYQKEKKVQSVMIEIRRDLYMNEQNGRKLKDYKAFKKQIQKILKEIQTEIKMKAIEN